MSSIINLKTSNSPTPPITPMTSPWSFSTFYMCEFSLLVHIKVSPLGCVSCALLRVPIFSLYVQASWIPTPLTGLKNKQVYYLSTDGLAQSTEKDEPCAIFQFFCWKPSIIWTSLKWLHFTARDEWDPQAVLVENYKWAPPQVEC